MPENTSIVLQDGTLEIAGSAFSGCTGLTSVIIPNSVTNIGDWAFYGCSSLTSVTIPNSVTSIGGYVFENCTGLTSIEIPNSVTSIGDYAFYECSGLTSIEIPNSVTSIGYRAFEGCSGLKSVELGDHLMNIGSSVFPSSAKLYAKRGSKTLLALWNGKYLSTYETGTETVLPPPTLSVDSVTQMTASVSVKNFYKEYTNTLNGENIDKETYVFMAPYPEYKGTVTLKVTKDDVTYSPNVVSFTTQSVKPTGGNSQSSASSLSVKAPYTHGDANVTSQTLALNGATVEGDSIFQSGLKPGTSYLLTYTIVVDERYTYTGSLSLRTMSMNFTTLQPKVVSEGNVVVGATSNLDEAETNVGFEWRRTDWTDDFQSNTAGAYLYQGTMEGYIRNMNTNYLWKYRPYYEANDGSRHYGSWVGIDPTNTSWFEPTVHTYAQYIIEANTAKVKGYVMRGSDNIESQGFKYWKATASASEGRRAPSSAITVEASGQVMETRLTGLDYETTYYYVAFVKTSEGETYYGEEQSFTTGEDLTGINELPMDNGQTAMPEGSYDLNGRRLARMQKGINIIRMSDGTTKKVMLK